MRHGQSFKALLGTGETAELLKALEAARAACLKAMAKAPVRGEVYLAAERLGAVIDDVAGVLTGNREHFWQKPH